MPRYSKITVTLTIEGDPGISAKHTFDVSEGLDRKFNGPVAVFNCALALDEYEDIDLVSMEFKYDSFIYKATRHN